MNIQTLSETELNYKLVGIIYGHDDKDINRLVSRGKLNFLTDWNLTMPLAVDNGISVINLGGTTQWFACTDVSFETVCMSPSGNDNGVSCMDCSNSQYSTSPLRAICEVLVMIGMEVK